MRPYATSVHRKTHTNAYTIHHTRPYYTLRRHFNALNPCVCVCACVCVYVYVYMYVYICSETCVNTNTRGGATFGREKRGEGLGGGIHGPGPAAYESAAAFKVRSGLDYITLVDRIRLDLRLRDCRLD